MLGCSHQALAQGIVVQIVNLRLPEALRLDLFGVSCRLPKTTLAIATRALCQHILKARRRVLGAEIREPPARELAKVRHDLLERLGLKVRVEQNRVQMGRPVTILQAASETKIGSQSTTLNVT